MKEIEYAAPETVEEAVKLLGENGARARMLAGGTDLIVQVREHRRDIDMMIDLKKIPEAMELSYDAKKGCTIGAAVPCVKIYEHEVIKKAYPGLIDAVSLVGGIQIQNRASIGGNMCNASPAADTTPIIIAHNGKCKIAGPNGVREIPAEDFCTGPGKTVMEDNEFLLSIHLPPPPKNFGAAYLRFIPRNEMDIAVVGTGVSVTLDESKSKCVEARISLGAVAPTPILVPEASAALVNGEIDETHIAQAAVVAQGAAKPISDMRGDAEYRVHLVKVLVRRALTTAIERAKAG